MLHCSIVRICKGFRLGISPQSLPIADGNLCVTPADLCAYDILMQNLLPKPRIALVAHNAKKADIVALATQFLTLLQHCTLCGTGTTSQRITLATGLQVEGLLSGPLGGDLQIGARLSEGQVDALIFLRDPMTSQPHEPDINALVRACDVHNIPCATNMASARLLLQALERSSLKLS